MESRQPEDCIIMQDIRKIEFLIWRLKNNESLNSVCAGISDDRFKSTLQKKGIKFLYDRLEECKAIRAANVPFSSYSSPFSGTTSVFVPLRHAKHESANYPSHFFRSDKISRKKTGEACSRLILTGENHQCKLEIDLEHIERTTPKDPGLKGKKDDADKRYPKGGFAIKVKKGFLPGTDKPLYAVKQLQSTANKEKFRYEAHRLMRSAYFSRLLGRTGHVTANNDSPCLITDWYDGCDLQHILKSGDVGKINSDIRIQYMFDLIYQLAIFHQNNIIHRDIKPGNVILTKDNAFLVDFDGVRLEGEPGYLVLSHTKAFLSDEHYMIVMRKQQDALDSFNKQSDLYALSITLAALFPEWISARCIETNLSDGNTRKKYVVRLKKWDNVIAQFIYSLYINNFSSATVALQALSKSQNLLNYTLPKPLPREIIERDLFNIRVESYHCGARKQVPETDLHHSSSDSEQPHSSIMPETHQEDSIFEMVMIPKRITNPDALLKQLIDLASQIIASDHAKNKFYGKYNQIRHYIDSANQHDGQISQQHLKAYAKILFHLIMQRNLPGMTNTTESGKLLRELLNDPTYCDLKLELFPDSAIVRYRDMRTFVAGGNNTAFFSFRRKAETLARYAPDELRAPHN